MYKSQLNINFRKVTITQLVNEPLLRQFEPKPKISKKNQTGNKNRKLNKIKLGNVKHELFEEIMLSKEKIRTEAAKKLVAKKLEKEQINNSNKNFNQYSNNLLLFFANCQVFKYKYIIHNEPIIFDSKHVYPWSNVYR